MISHSVGAAASYPFRKDQSNPFPQVRMQPVEILNQKRELCRMAHPSMSSEHKS